MKNKKLLFSIMFPYLSIALISIIGILFANGVLLKKCEDVYIDILDKSTSSVIESNENRIETILTMSDILLSNSDINHLVVQKPDDSRSDLAETLKAVNLIKTHSFDSKFVKDIYIYDTDRNIIIDKATIYRSIKKFYDNREYKDIVSYNNWRSIITNEIWVRGYFDLKDGDEKDPKKLFFIQSIPLNFPSKASGKLVVELSVDEIRKSFSDILKHQEGQLFVFEHTGKVLYTTDNTFDTDYIYKNRKHKSFISVNQGKFLPVSSDNNSFGLKFVVLLPKKNVSRSIFGVKLMTISVEIFLVILCMVLCIRFSRRKKEDLFDLFELLRFDNNELKTFISSNKKINDMDIIKKLVANMVEDRENDKSEKKLLLKNAVLREIITNVDVEFSDDVINSYSLDAEKFALVLLRIGEVASSQNCVKNETKGLVINILQSLFSNRAEIVDLNSKEIALLFFFAKEEKEKQILSEFVSNATVSINYERNLNVKYAIGATFDNILEANKAYKQAKKVLRYVEFHDDEKIIFYNEIPTKIQKRYYPLAVETQIYNYAVSGNSQKAIDILDFIYEENFVKNNCSAEESELLINDINSTMIQIHEALFGDGMTEKILPGSVQEFFEYAKVFLNNSTNKVTREKFKKSKRAMNDIIAYVDKNYMNSSLSLTTLSKEFNLHEHYISTKFKEYSGDNFSNYLEKKRIDVACELLLKNEHTISEISIMVGYSSDLSFRRAFKKITGTTPSKYTNM